MASRRAASDSRWGGPKVALGAILLLAAALRVVGVEYGLPHGNLLNPDEAAIVPRAWTMVHGGGADPHPFFDYPSLLLYMLAPFQAWADDPDYLAARAVAVAIGVAGTAAAWWFGARAFHRVAGAVAATATAVATVHVAYSRAAVTDVLLTTLVTVALGLLASGRVELAGACAGLATAAKYPGVVLLAPILAVAWGQWRRVALAGLLMLVAFVVATPFVLVHVAEAAGDAARVHRWARSGWLGFEDDPVAPVAFSTELWDALGPVVVLAAVGLVVAFVTRTTADRAVAAFVVAYFLTLLPLDSHFDRYVLPLVPALGVLAGRFRAIAPVTFLLLVVPFTWSVRETRELTRTDARAAAFARVEREVGTGVVAFDPGLPRPGVRGLALELPAPWQRADPNRDVARLERAHPAVTHVWVNGSIVDRVRAAPREYPRETRFYALLERDARLVFRLDDRDGYAGPWTALFELPSTLASEV